MSQLAVAGLFAMAALGWVVAPAWADYPLYGIAQTVNAPTVVVSTFNVDPSSTAALIDDLVQSGPYNRGGGGLMDETISQGIADGGKPMDVFSVSIFQSSNAAESATTLRKSVLRTAQTREPAYIQATVVEHLLANWGWERGQQVQFLRVVPGKPTNIYDNYGSSLAFFKSGYTGQMSMLEFFQPGASLDAVRAELTKRSGMSGASIYRDEATGNYIVYSQYFDTASALAAQSDSLVADRRMGQVTQNYRAR
ncbi:MAG: hypothetical protein WAM82_20690 [Thermoanaerobaculia bacterium]